MKRKFVLLTILMCILGGFNLSNLNAQTQPVTIGSGDLEENENDKFPLYTFYEYSISQQIYTADDLAQLSAGAVIKSIAFNVTSTGGDPTDRVFSIYMQNTTKDEFSSATDHVIMNSSDLVYTVPKESPITFNTTIGWYTFILDTPFTYEGNNILVCVHDYTNSYASPPSFSLNSTEGKNRAIFGFDYNPIGDPVSGIIGIPDAYGQNLGMIQGHNQIQLTFEAPESEEGGDVVIGDENSIVPWSSLPLDLYYSYYVSQQLFTSDEIKNTSGGTISSIAVKFFGETNSGTASLTDTPYGTIFSRDVEVYISSTDLDNLTGGVNLASNQTVNFDGTVTFTPGEWTEFEFTTPYLYDGGNIIITMYDKTGESGTGNYTHFYAENISGRAIQSGSTSDPYSLTSLASIGNTVQYRNQMQIKFDDSAPKPFTLTASAAKETIFDNETVKLTAKAKGGSGNYTYSWSPVTGLDNATIANPTFTPTAAGTYTFTCTVSDGTETLTADVTVTVNEAPKEIVIGTTGQINSSDFPTNINWRYSLTQQIYTSAEIGINKNLNIKSISFKNSSANSDTRNIEIYMRNTTDSNCENTSTAMVSSELVYSGDVTFVGSDWTTITFTTPFEYEGGKNILLCVVDKSGYFTTSTNFDVYISSGDSYYYRSDNNPQYAVNSNNGTGVVSYRNCIKLEYEEAIELDPAIPTGLTATAITSKTVDLSWNSAANAKSYNVYKNDEFVLNVQGTSFKVEGLDPETEYCFTVTAVNVTKESNHSEKVCVTTSAPIRPDAPTNLAISVNVVSITLTWSEVANAESYNVYQDGTKISSGITSPTFTIGGLDENTRYCYTVTAVADLESEHSDELCAKTTEIGGEDKDKDIAGNNSQTSTLLPIYTSGANRYSITQQYYTKEEIDNPSGNITSISFYVYQASSSLTHNLEIYLNNMDEFGFESANYQAPCYQVSSSDLVFEGNVSFPTSDGWVKIKLDKPFMYTGKHILVTVVNNTTVPNVFTKIAFYARLNATVDSKDCAGYHYNESIIDPTTSSYTMMMTTNRNDIRFTFAASAPTIEFITDGDWNTASNWKTGVVPSTTDDVIIKANATINGDVAVKHLSVEGGSLTIESGSLTVADIMVNNYAEDLIIKDGAQLLQGYDKVKGTFQMNINNPDEWSEWNKTGWQFIASPFTNAAVSQFTDADTYDLYKFDGSHENITEEWRNHKDADANFETEFVSGRGYMASYQNNTTATLSGTFYAGSSITYPVTYQDIQEGEPHWPNFHLLGNPFTFNMDLSKLNMANMATGVAVVNEVGGYDYMETGTINVGDGFFVKSADASPSVSYGTRGGNNNNVSENISVRVSNSTSRDNVVLNFAGADKVGFPKLNARNEDIAYLYVVDNEKRYGIFNYDKDVKEVPLSFETQKMGRYTISVDAEGEYETIVLVDRQTGIETNMLLEDYNFTATTSKKENTDRFIVRFTFKSDEVTETERFAYQSGDELIIEAEGTVQLFDVMGRMLYINDIENHGDRINVGHLNNAAYILRLVNGDGVKVQKVIIY